eukprot:322270-Rhodomonas_salina.2
MSVSDARLALAGARTARTPARSASSHSPPSTSSRPLRSSLLQVSLLLLQPMRAAPRVMERQGGDWSG